MHLIHLVLSNNTFDNVIVKLAKSVGTLFLASSQCNTGQLETKYLPTVININSEQCGVGECIVL